MIQPFSFECQVIHGYGRGSKQLDCPTANVDMVSFKKDFLPFRNGIYWGYASVENGPVYRCAINIGVCPYFKNDQRTFEVHLIDYDGPDFYESRMIQEDLKWIKEQ